MEQLATESSVLEFSTAPTMGEMPPESYSLRFLGRGLWKDATSGRVLVREEHEVGVQLGASYPRTIPELTWRTPFYHPNVSGSGIVCLGGYSTHWVPSLGLHNLCEMLWDMIRYHNFDTESPYNREAAHWVKTQRDFQFPLDKRPIRDRLANLAPFDPRPPVVAAPLHSLPQEVVFIEPKTDPARPNGSGGVQEAGQDHELGEIIEAELVDGPAGTNSDGASLRDDPDILFID
jgi:hypothetical protein